MKPALRVPEAIYAARCQRMKRLIELQAPYCIIELEARTLLRSFARRSLWEVYQQGLWRGAAPHWLQWISSSAYRQACREMDEDGSLEQYEADMREILRPQPEPSSESPPEP